MRTWDLTLPLDGGGAALFERIAAAVARGIEGGRLPSGERLPSTRALADQLGVNRNTVVAAYEALRRDGWVEARSTRGLFVRARPTPAQPPPFAPPLPEVLPFLRHTPRHPNLRILLGGVPDLRLIPSRELARAYARVLRGARGRRSLDYGDPQGTERLRIALGAMLSQTRALFAPPERVCVVRGSQHALFLAAHALLRPGDRVAVEAIGYPPAWRALEIAGCALVPVPIDADGMDVGALAAECARAPVRAVLVTPHHQYPTTVPMSPSRRAALLALARAQRMMVIEDDYDFEFAYDGPPLAPLAAEDGGAHVVYVATLSKTLAPGLRVGCVVGHPDVIARVTAHRRWVDHQGDHVLELAVAELLEDGDIQRHARRMRRVYRSRRDALIAALREHLPDLEFAPPGGGMAVWARAPGVDATAWSKRALDADVAVQAGEPLFHGGAPTAREHLRIGFAACTEAELAEAVGRLAQVR